MARSVKAPKPVKTVEPVKAAVQAARPAAKPARAKPPLAAPARAKPARKPRKVRAQLVRDGFTMPEADFGLLAMLKSRALAFGRVAKKSELLRAGLHALAAIDSPGLVAALDQLEPVKIGRPRKSP